MRPLRAVLALHRWLGVGVGLLMTIWCLSGFVMLFWDYPRLLPAEELRGLEILRMPAATGLARVDLPSHQPLASARIEMLAGHAVLRVAPAGERGRTIRQVRATPLAYDLATGAPRTALAPGDPAVIAREFAAQSGIAGPVTALAETPVDQWTVQTYARNAPLYRADFADPAGNRIYISGPSGEVVQQATRAERFWGWLGAVPHWLYPTLLRQEVALWTQMVIWSSLLGCFLTIAGFAVGIARLRRSENGYGSPFRGLWWWHHTLGLVFGILTLTWVASGLLSMNPWGLLDSNAGPAERERLRGPADWQSVRSAFAALPEVPAGTVRLEAAPLGGKVFVIATRADGTAIRLSPQGAPVPLDAAEMRKALSGVPLTSLVLLREDDAYYRDISIPVWRAILADPTATRLYIDATSGQLVRAFDGNARSFRWLHNGLHSFDFAVLGQGGLRFTLVLALLAGVTLVCASGTWMAWRKARRDLRRLHRHRTPSARRSPAIAAPA
jgi:uncharacterized iron-regulated membrane protein